MTLEIWVGKVEIRQLPGQNHNIELTGKGAFTWITCWASNEEGYVNKVRKVMESDGLFVVDIENVMPFAKAEERGMVSDELLEQFADTSKNQNYCIFGTFHTYMSDH